MFNLYPLKTPIKQGGKYFYTLNAHMGFKPLNATLNQIHKFCSFYGCNMVML